MSARFRGWGYQQRGRHALLVNQDATTTRLLDEIANASTAPDLDLLLIYWAGPMQSVGKKHTLLTADAGEAGGAGVGLDVLVGAIGAASQVPYRVLILDSCHVAAAQSQLAALSRQASEDGCVTVLAAGGSTPMEREDLRRGYFTGALLEQLPRDTRGLPPNIDLIQALRSGAEQLPGRRREQPLIEIHGAVTELRLPVVGGKTLPFESRSRVGRAPGKLIAASQGHRKASA